MAVSPELTEEDELPLLRALMQASDYGVLFSDSQRQDIICNRRCAELFAIEGERAVRSSPEAVRAMFVPRLKDPEGFLQALEQIYANPDYIGEDEVELREPPRILRRYTAPVRNEMGRIVGRLWTFLDITHVRSLERQVAAQAAELRIRAAQLAVALKTTSGRLHKTEVVLARAQRKLLESEKLSAVGLLAASIAHDIGNVLTPLAIEISLADRDDPRERRMALAALRDQIGRLSLLTHRLPAYAAPNPVPHSPVDLRRVLGELDRVLRPQASLMGINLTLLSPANLPPVIGDKAQIEQVVVNLALNGLQAMQEQGAGSLEIRAAKRRDDVALRVSDTGPGIPPEVRRRLFDPFFSTRPGGTGLGLFSCRGVVKAHGGVIRVRSRPGRGTSFSVILPIYRERGSSAGVSEDESQNAR